MGTFVAHTGCSACGSKDNLGVYIEENNTYNAACFGCGHYYEHDELIDEGILSASGEFEYKNISSKRRKPVSQEEINSILEKDVRGFRERRIKKSTAEKYGVRCSYDESGNISHYYFPSYSQSNSLIGWKEKPIEKTDGKYLYKSIGSYKVTDSLFGQNLFEAGGKFIVITTGQEDAMAFYETLSDGKYETPCVSLNNGDGSVKKQFQANYEYISSFEKVILAFDNDKPAQEALEIACKMLKPNQAHIAKLELKDACEYKKKGLEHKLKNIFWKAERYSPIDICSLGEMWDEFATAVEDEIIPLPPEFGELADMMGGGPAKGEVTVIGALTSVGKSTLINRVAYYAAIENQFRHFKTGLMYLESSARETVKNFLSIHSGTNLSLKKLDSNRLNELKKYFDDLVKEDNRILSVNHHGAFRDIDEMVDKLRWMAKAGECELLIVDPLQAAVPDNSNDMLDKFMDAMLKLAKETNAAIVVVSHMRKPDGKDPHDVDEYSLKGSSSINQIAFNTIMISRDKINESPLIKNTTKLTLVKCRRTGNTGHAGWLRYIPDTVKLQAVGNPYDEDEGFGDEYIEDEEVEEVTESSGDFEFKIPEED